MKSGYPFLFTIGMYYAYDEWIDFFVIGIWIFLFERSRGGSRTDQLKNEKWLSKWLSISLS